MNRTKVAITIEEGLLAKVDALVRRQVYANRSQAIQEALREMFARLERSRLAEECAKLDPSFERSMAEAGLSESAFAHLRGIATVKMSTDEIMALTRGKG